MEQITNYVKPELLIVAVVLYFVGMGLKHAQAVKDKYIPLILGGIGIILCAVWVLRRVRLKQGRTLLWGSLPQLCRVFLWQD